MKKYGLPKERRITRKKIFESLVHEGRSAFAYPVKAVYLPMELPGGVPFQVAFAVSKKRFRKAVRRNRIKRLLREAFRLNQHALDGSGPVAVLFIYVAKEEVPFERLMQQMDKILRQIRQDLGDGATQ
jgi:ribonuclease P protein component